MKVKVQDILKDARTLTTGGLVLIALWIALLPTYKAHIEGQRAVRHLAAYLQLKQLLGQKWNSLVIAAPKEISEDSTYPAAHNKQFLLNPMSKGSSVSVCEIDKIQQATTEPISKPATMGDCALLAAVLPDREAKTVALIFKTSENKLGDLYPAVLGEYTVSSLDQELPFNSYRVLVALATSGPQGAFRAAKRESANSAGKEAEDAAQDPQRHCTATDALYGEAFRKCYDVFVIRNFDANADAVPPEVLANTTIEASIRSLTSGFATARLRREPPYWAASQALLAAETGKVPELNDLHYSDTAVTALVTRYLRDEGTSDVAGIKVPISLVPWAIAAVLAMTACLLYGCLSSLRQVAAEDVTEDFGWLLMQTRATHGRAADLVAWLLIVLATGAIAWVEWSTLLAAGTLSSWPALAVYLLALQVLAFAGIALALSVRQRSIARFISRSVAAPPAAAGGAEAETG